MSAQPAKVARNRWAENPGYNLTVAPFAGRVTVRFAGEVVADSSRALLLKERGHAPVYYIPREDMRMDLLRRSDHHTHCGYKGHCSYYSVVVRDRTSENAIWSYEEPYPEMLSIRGYAAFYPERVDSISVA